METPPTKKRLKVDYRFLILSVLIGALLGAWLLYTPPGILGKSDAVGYAVCHQIPERSFHIGDRPISLCARCSGMYLGAFIGLAFHFRYRRRGGMPAKKIYILLGLFFLAFAVDGGNSYIYLLKEKMSLAGLARLPNLYVPNNTLRLITGTGMGLGISALLVPIFNQTVWTTWEDLPVLGSWKQTFILVALAGLMIVTVLTESPIVLYPLTLLGTLTVVGLLTLIYAVLWVMISKKDNTFQTWRQLAFFFLLGFGTALFQIAVMNLMRYLLTGSWAGFFA